MLNKEICKRCCKRHRDCDFVGLSGWWDSSDEFLWNDGSVLCPSCFILTSSLVSQPPKKKCGYVLEQLVLGQEGKLPC